MINIADTLDITECPAGNCLLFVLITPCPFPKSLQFMGLALLFSKWMDEQAGTGPFKTWIVHSSGLNGA